MFYTSIKKINRLRKEIDRLLMSNVYLKVTIEKSWQSQNLDSQNLKKIFTWSSNFKTSCYNLNIRDLGAKPCVVFLLF